MKRLVGLIALGTILGALFAIACGDGNQKPPLTPDSEHHDDGGGGGATGGDGGK
jgi:hypothetical protein